MECIVENDSEITRKLYLEVIKSCNEKFKYVYGICGALMIVLSLMMILVSKVDITTFILMFFGVYLILYRNIIIYHIITKRSYKQFLIMSSENDVAHRITRFYQDYLEVICTNGSKSVVQYSNVKKPIITRNMYILTLNEKVLIIMRKDSFIKGSIDDVQKLIWG